MLAHKKLLGLKVRMSFVSMWMKKSYMQNKQLWCDAAWNRNIQAFIQANMCQYKPKQPVAYNWGTMLCESTKTHQLKVACKLKLQVSSNMILLILYVSRKDVIYGFELSNKQWWFWYESQLPWGTGVKLPLKCTAVEQLLLHSTKRDWE